MRLLALFLAGLSLTMGRADPLPEQKNDKRVDKVLSRCGGATDYAVNQLIRSELVQFSTSAFRAVSNRVGANENVLISPSSIATVLAMVYAGAKGKTAEEIKEALALSAFSDDKILCVLGTLFQNMRGHESFDLFLEAANRVYIANAYKLADSFLSKLDDNFEATAKSVNFGNDATRLEINQWVKESTGGKIKELIPVGVLDSLTRLVLVNAVYFKGGWLSKFNPDETKMGSFHPGSGREAIQIPMMHAYGSFRNVFVESVNARALELPYAGEELSMVILLPEEADGLRAVESKVDGSLVNEILKMLDGPGRAGELDVAIPKFKIESSMQLKKDLEEIKINRLFSGTADLSGMLEKQDELQVSDVFHNTFLEVNEEGTEAAAATGVHVVAISAWIIPPFKADRPFMFFIVDKLTKSILFIGRFANPAA